MINNILLSLAFTISYMLSSLSGISQDKDPGNKNIKGIITGLNKDMEDAFNKNDMVKVASFYSDDAEIAGANNVVKGRTALDQYWLNLKDLGRGWKLFIIETGGNGELVYQLGRSDLRFIREGKERRSEINFILLWKRTADGSYKIYRDYLTKVEFIR